MRNRYKAGSAWSSSQNGTDRYSRGGASQTLLIPGLLAPPFLFEQTGAAFRLQTAFGRSSAGLRGSAGLGNVKRLSQQALKALDDLDAVAKLAASSLAGQMQNTAAINNRFQLAEDASTLRFVQAGRSLHVERQLHLRCRPVDVLTARAAAAAEKKLQLRHRNGHRVGDVQVRWVGHDFRVPAPCSGRRRERRWPHRPPPGWWSAAA